MERWLPSRLSPHGVQARLGAQQRILRLLYGETVSRLGSQRSGHSEPTLSLPLRPKKQTSVLFWRWGWR